MINANELRIGNLYKDASGNIESVKPWDLSEWEESNEPIPLSPEVLEQCGFEKYSMGHWMNLDSHGCDGFRFENNEFSIVEAIDRFYTPCLYLHQLQNLYFALTQQELEVKIKSPAS